MLHEVPVKPAFLRFLVTTLVLLAAPAALASSATYLVFVPGQMAVGGMQTGVYAVKGFSAHEGLAGPALVDASMTELQRLLGDDAAAIQYTVRGTSASVTIAGDGKVDPAIRDRALGAVYHTLRLAGMTDVRLDDAPITSNSFSRGALLPVMPFASVLPPRRLAHGFVVLGGKPIGADEFYRRVAAGHGTIRDAIAESLSSGASSVKLQILGALPAIQVKDSLGLLLPRLTDEDPAVRLAVLDMMKDYRDGKSLKALEEVVETDPDPTAKTAAAKILVAAGKSGYRKYLLLEKLRSSNPRVVIPAAQELIQLGDARLAPALADLVWSSEAEIRQVGVQALRHFKLYDKMDAALRKPELDRATARPLALTLTDDTDGTSQATGISWLLANAERADAVHAAETAAKQRTSGATDALGAALKRTEPEVRKASAIALGALRDPAGLEALAQAVRATSVDAERDLYTEQAITIIAVQPLDQVIRISESPDETIRQLAVKSLAEFAKDRPNPKVLSVLRKHLSDTNKTIRQAAVYALARIQGDPSVTKELVGLKGDANAVVRAQVAHALVLAEHPEADSILIAMLDDMDNAVKLAAANAVRERKVTSALDKLKWLVEYRHTEVRRAVVRAIVSLAQPADPALFDLYQPRLYDQDAEVRLIAVAALGQYQSDPRTAPALGGAVTDQDRRVKLAALGVLASSPDTNAVEQVIRGLFDSDRDVKLKTLDALEQMASPKARKALQEFVLNESDAAVKTRAGEVLDKL